MKTFISLIIAMLSFSSTFSQQQVWQTILTHTEDVLLMDVKENNNNDIFISVNVYKLNGTKDYAQLFKINRTGEVLETILLADSIKTNYLSSIHILENGFLSSFGASFDSLNGLDVSFFNRIYNLNLQEVSSRNHTIKPTTRILDFFTSIRPHNSILLFGACIIDPTRFTSMIYEFDSTLNLLKWNLPDSNNYGKYVDLKQLNDSTYWALKVFPWFYEKLDSNFNRIEYYHLPHNLKGNISCKWLNDSAFYMLGKYWYTTPVLSQPHNLALVKQLHPFDTTGPIFRPWNITDTVDFQAVWKGIDFKNPDTLFAGGTHNLELYNPYYGNQPSWLVVLQTDSMLNLRWERFYGGDAYYVMTNLIASRDGGCLVGGTRFDYQNTTVNKRDIILLKLNSEGLLTGINNPSTMQLCEAIIYPNPGSSQLKVRLAIQHPQALFQLFDQGGRLVMQQQLTTTESELETNHLATGIYVYRITSSTGLNENGKWVKQ